jgi:hypothetical protein
MLAKGAVLSQVMVELDAPPVGDGLEFALLAPIFVLPNRRKRAKTSR